MKTCLSLILLFFTLATPPIVAGSLENCDYDVFSGKRIGKFSANAPKDARSWVPLELILCKNKDGVYAIISHVAVALGVLYEPPLELRSTKNLNSKNKQFVLLWNSPEDDREAVAALETKNVEAVVRGGTSKTQLVVFRKELGRVFSNTLFGEFEKEEAIK